MGADALRIGELSVPSGQKAVALQKITVAGHDVNLPVFAINGKDPGPTLVVTGGIHGAEYASVEAALRLGRTQQPDDLRGRLVVLPVTNPPAFQARSIYVCPLDGTNLNRVFPGRADGSASEQLASWLFENAIKQADYYVDLHGGDLIEALLPFTIYHRSGDDAVDKVSMEMAKVFGIPYVVRSETVGSTYSAASRAGIPAILTEAGGQGIWLPEHVAAHSNGLNRLMRHLGMLAGPPPEPLPIQLLDQFIWMRSECDGFYYPKVAVGDVVRKGQDIGQVADFRGNVLQPMAAPADGRVLFLVSSLAINKGDPLLAVGA